MKPDAIQKVFAFVGHRSKLLERYSGWMLAPFAVDGPTPGAAVTDGHMLFVAAGSFDGASRDAPAGAVEFAARALQQVPAENIKIAKLRKWLGDESCRLCCDAMTMRCAACTRGLCQCVVCEQGGEPVECAGCGGTNRMMCPCGYDADEGLVAAVSGEHFHRAKLRGVLRHHEGLVSVDLLPEQNGPRRPVRIAYRDRWALVAMPLKQENVEGRKLIELALDAEVTS